MMDETDAQVIRQEQIEDMKRQAEEFFANAERFLSQCKQQGGNK